MIELTADQKAQVSTFVRYPEHPRPQWITELLITQIESFMIQHIVLWEDTFVTDGSYRMERSHALYSEYGSRYRYDEYRDFFERIISGYCRIVGEAKVRQLIEDLDD